MYTHCMRTTVRTWGNSLAVRIPKAFAMHMGIDSGGGIELSLQSDGLLIASVKQDLQVLLAKVTPENLHGETKTGSAVGREIW